MSEEFYDGFMMNCGYIEWPIWVVLCYMTVGCA